MGNSEFGAVIKYGTEIGKKDKSHKFIELECPLCHIKRWVELYRFRHSGNSICHKCFLKQHNVRKAGRGSASPGWKGGRRQKGDYIQIWLSPDDPYYAMANKQGYILEHRLIMAKALGRYLNGKEEVHHLNGITTDNRIKNLAVVHSSNHPKQTLLTLAQKRIRDLEAELSQQRLVL